MEITKELLLQYGITLKEISKATDIAHPHVSVILNSTLRDKIQKKGNQLLQQKMKELEKLNGCKG